MMCVCRSVARDKSTLLSLGVTHVLNAAAGRHRINTGQQFYSDLDVEYLGVEAADHPEFNIQPFFEPAAQFIDSALKKDGQYANITPELIFYMYDKYTTQDITKLVPAFFFLSYFSYSSCPGSCLFTLHQFFFPLNSLF